MILYVSPVSVYGSGYSHIGTNICTALNQTLDKVMCLSIDYHREEHNFDFGLIPSNSRNLSGQIKALCNTPSVGIKLVIIAMDIPMLIDLMNIADFGRKPVWGIFPVEAGPLTDSWAMQLWKLNERFTISKFGQRMCQDQRLPTHYLPIPANSIFNPNINTNGLIEELQIKDQFVISTVADNQERKNLSAGLEIFKEFNSGVCADSVYVLVTRLNSTIGWDLKDLVRRHGLKNKVRLLEKKQSISKLAEIYKCSDAVLFTSKAEGLCMPMREAISVGALVLGTDCTGMSEQLQDGGFPIASEYDYTDAFGNTQRYFIDKQLALNTLKRIHRMDCDEIEFFRNRAIESVKGLAWQESIKILLDQVPQEPELELAS